MDLERRGVGDGSGSSPGKVLTLDFPWDKKKNVSFGVILIRVSVNSASQRKDSWRAVVTLAYQSLGVVYGDLSTSPLYVYKNTFAEDIEHSETNEEIYGVLSFVFWTLTLVPLLKYVLIVLRADDNGEGGTFALYSLLCRHARVGFLPNGQLADEELSTYKKVDGGGAALPSASVTTASTVKRLLEKHQVLQRLLLILALIGTSMVIGDGVLTPAISGHIFFFFFFLLLILDSPTIWGCSDQLMVALQFSRLFQGSSSPCPRSNTSAFSPSIMDEQTAFPSDPDAAAVLVASSVIAESAYYLDFYLLWPYTH
ncbi:hypothetical protein BHM03_00023016 [Ensete ventricosum]|nr:hypothetical protein BHM03_00023016 [Ensete ventricosum]